MRTVRQCWEKATECERLARSCSSPVGKRALLEMARQWRSQARFAPPAAPTRVNGSPAGPGLDEAALDEMLSDVGAFIK